MGRRKLKDKDPTWVSRLVDTYTFTGSEVKTADKMGCSERTVRSYLHEEGIYPPAGRPRGVYSNNDFNGAFPRWLRSNPGTPLPESPREIANLTGCTIDEVSSHLHRVRKAIKREIEALPDLRSLEAVIPDEEDRPIPLRAIKSYRILIKKHSRKIKIQATLKGGKEVTFHTHLDYVWEVVPRGYWKSVVKDPHQTPQ